MIIGIGLDIIEISQIAEALEKSNERFKRRIFTPGEQEYCLSHAYPAQHFAVRFAAKEAVLKVLGTGWCPGIKWTDINVGIQPMGQPFITLQSEVSEIASRMGIQTWYLSLSHSKFYAAAFAVAEAQPHENKHIPE